uniref:Putative tail protein n=1 Tax=viral metagenome TaxID=1070528 RepID=A0A6M3KRQ1_9ZZZZ
MAVALDVKIDDRDLHNVLQRIRQRFGNLKPALRIIGETVQASIQQNFEAGGRPEKWVDLAEATKKARAAKRKWPGQILVVTGLMKKITYQVEDDRVTLTAGSEYAAAHHFGVDKTVQVSAHSRRRRSYDVSRDRKKVASGVVFVKGHSRHMKLPARPFMMLQNEDWPEINESLAEHLLK